MIGKLKLQNPNHNVKKMKGKMDIRKLGVHVCACVCEREREHAYPSLLQWPALAVTEEWAAVGSLETVISRF